jgi:hypothetical protein
MKVPILIRNAKHDSDTIVGWIMQAQQRGSYQYDEDMDRAISRKFGVSPDVATKYRHLVTTSSPLWPSQKDIDKFDK